MKRLTALWAFTESGLGGLLHALHIPLTGLFVGGMAVLILSFIAYYSNYSSRQIIKSTLIVLTIKAMVAPYTPPMAYVAVSFQGLMAVVCFCFFRLNYATAICMGIITMIESALQKIIVLTLFWGNTFWKGLDELIITVTKFLGMPVTGASWWLIVLYLLFFSLAGAIVGWFAVRLIKKIASRPSGLYIIQNIKEVTGNSSVKKRKSVWLVFLALFIISLSLLFIAGKYNLLDAAKAILWTATAVMLWYLLIAPLFAKLIPRLLHKTKSKYAADINDAVKMFPSFKAISHAAWQQSSDKKGLKKVFTFVGNLITWCVLYKEEVEEKGADIIIFSKPIHSGKTTELQLWSNGKKNIAGILMPDINYKRKMQNIATGEIFDAEINDVATPDNQIEMIGTYVFYAAAFKKAYHILCNATAQNPDWIIIDEVGKLEMTEGGFYKSVKYILENKGCHTKLLLVVRDGLVNNVIDFFKISNYRIADNSRSF